MTTREQTAADLLAAARHIQQYGHIKGKYGALGKPCCMVGALQVAVFGQTLDEDGAVPTVLSRRYDVARDALFQEIPEGRRMPDWNDAPERTEAEVVAKFNKAAERVVS